MNYISLFLSYSHFFSQYFALQHSSSMLSHRLQFVPSFPKDILFSGGELTSEDALNSLLWETCAPARIASRAGSFFDATPFPHLPIRPLSPHSFLPQVFLRVVARQKRLLCMFRGDKRAEKKEGGDETLPAAFCEKERRSLSLSRQRPGQELVFSPAIHISWYESTDQYRRGPLRKNDSSRFDS